MAPGITLRLLPSRRSTDTLPRWQVRDEGRLIGRIESTRLARATSTFYDAYVLINGREINIEASTDLDERCDLILAAWQDPASNVHLSCWLRLQES